MSCNNLNLFQKNTSPAQKIFLIQLQQKKILIAPFLQQQQ